MFKNFTWVASLGFFVTINCQSTFCSDFTEVFNSMYKNSRFIKRHVKDIDWQSGNILLDNPLGKQVFLDLYSSSFKQKPKPVKDIDFDKDIIIFQNLEDNSKK